MTLVHWAVSHASLSWTHSSAKTKYDLFLNEIASPVVGPNVACRNTVHELPVRLTSLYIRIPKTPRTEPGKNDLHYCQRTTASGGLPFTSSGGRTELVWKHDIRLGCKGLRLKAKHADQIHYVHLGKLAVVKASNRNKGLADFRSEPQWPVRTPTLQPRLGVCRGRRRYKRPDSHPIRGRVSGSGGSNRRKETAMRLFTPVR